jgi:hypothetical protein
VAGAMRSEWTHWNVAVYLTFAALDVLFLTATGVAWWL